MDIKTFEARYELAEFCHYVDNTLSTGPISVIELLVDTPDINYLEDELSTIFAVETGKQTYVFSGYQVVECYKDDNNLIKIVCIK